MKRMEYYADIILEWFDRVLFGEKAERIIWNILLICIGWLFGYLYFRLQ